MNLTKDSIDSHYKIKKALTTTPLVKNFNWQLPITLETDATQRFIGAVLLQPHLNSKNSERSFLHWVAYFSRKLNDTQQRYSAQERGLLCILLSLQHWHHWIKGGDVTVITDHQSLKSIQTKSEQPARILRFLDSIKHYRILIIYRKGKANKLADYLSRPPNSINNNTNDKDNDNLIESTNLFPIEEEEVDDPYPTEDEPELKQVEYPEQLKRIDLQCIFEFLV